MKVEFLLEKVEGLAKRFPDLDPLNVEFNGIEIIIDLDIEDFKRILSRIPSGSCAGIVTSDGRIILRNRWNFEGIGDVLFRTSL